MYRYNNPNTLTDTHAYRFFVFITLSKNMQIVFNLAFCGEVAGNKFMTDCPDEAAQFNVTNDPVKTCNAYIESDLEALEEAYWKIKAVYVYERELEKMLTEMNSGSI